MVLYCGLLNFLFIDMVNHIYFAQFFLLFTYFFLIPIGILFNLALVYFEGYSTIVTLNLVLWIFLRVSKLRQKRNYTVEVHKGPLVAEVFISIHKKEALQIKKL